MICGRNAFVQDSFDFTSDVRHRHHQPSAIRPHQDTVFTANSAKSNLREHRSGACCGRSQVLCRSARRFRRASRAWAVPLGLKGAKPSDLPVQEPTKIDLTVNRCNLLRCMSPLAARQRSSGHIKKLGQDGFQDVVGKIVRNMTQTQLLRDCPGVTPWFRGQQRQWLSINSIPYLAKP